MEFSFWNPKTKTLKERDLSVDGRTFSWFFGNDTWYQCPDCHCIAKEDDLSQESMKENHPSSCPVCGSEMDVFDWEGILELYDGDDSWMFPDGHDDGEDLGLMFEGED